MRGGGQQEAVDFYLKNFWYGMRLNELHSIRLQFALMDAAVLFGDAYIKNILPQIVEVNSYDDAILYLSYLTDINGEVDVLINQLKAVLKNRIKELSNANSSLNVFVKGWNKRVEQY